MLWLMHLEVFHEDRLLPASINVMLGFSTWVLFGPQIAIEVCTEDKLLTNFHQCDIDSFISNWIIFDPWIAMELCTEEFVKQPKKKKT